MDRVSSDQVHVQTAETMLFLSFSGMRTRLVQGHAYVCIINGSTNLLIAHLEVWSGKAHYYLHRIRLTLWAQSAYIYARARLLLTATSIYAHNTNKCQPR